MENNENLNVNELSMDELEEVSGGKKSSKKRVKATKGDTYVRRYPDRDSRDFGVLYQGDSLPFLNETEYDDRPVLWYKVKYNGQAGWVSSKFTKLITVD